MFSGVAWMLLCLLPDFWTLPEEGDATDGMEIGVDCGESLAPAGTL
jgi:hypothetical protein